jgi:hypothetical protein
MDEKPRYIERSFPVEPGVVEYHKPSLPPATHKKLTPEQRAARDEWYRNNQEAHRLERATRLINRGW